MTDKNKNDTKLQPSSYIRIMNQLKQLVRKEIDRNLWPSYLYNQLSSQLATK